MIQQLEYIMKRFTKARIYTFTTEQQLKNHVTRTLDLNVIVKDLSDTKANNAKINSKIMQIQQHLIDNIYTLITIADTIQVSQAVCEVCIAYSGYPHFELMLSTQERNYFITDPFPKPTENVYDILKPELISHAALTYLYVANNLIPSLFSECQVERNLAQYLINNKTTDSYNTPKPPHQYRTTHWHTNYWNSTTQCDKVLPTL